MQLGITAKLQQRLHLAAPPYGEAEELFFCWELQCRKYKRRTALVAVNASNRFALILWGMNLWDFKRTPERFEEALKAAWLEEGYEESVTDRYLKAAGPYVFTKTHGRRPLSGLNRVNEMLDFMDDAGEPSQLFQPKISRRINGEVCRAAGYVGYGYPREFLERDLRKYGILI